MNELLIEGGTVLFPDEERTERADVAIENGTIKSIGQEDTPKDVDRLNVEGCYVSPGFIDLQVNGGAGVDFLTCDALGPGRRSTHPGEMRCGLRACPRHTARPRGRRARTSGT